VQKTDTVCERKQLQLTFSDAFNQPIQKKKTSTPTLAEKAATTKNERIQLSEKDRRESVVIS